MKKEEKKNNSSNSTSKITEMEEKVIEIRRVSKKTKGGSTMGFTALVVVGDRDGKIGYGYGKAGNVADAIGKAFSSAKKDMQKINLKGKTIPHEVTAKLGASKVLLKPAPEGTGIIAGGSVRTVVDLVGIKDISSKVLGSNNKLSNVRCAIKALKKLKG
jgi:small subunit ribosomal protein S5